MSDDADPIALLFGGMPKLAPGDDAATLRMLERLPRRKFAVVVDAGCGSGRQTLALARALGTPIDAVDLHQPFLDELSAAARQAGLAHLVRVHALDMQDIARAFPRIDLLWSEGAAYNIGFENALATWAAAIVPGGFAVVSELTWLVERPPREAAEFFGACYPAMQSMEQNIAAAERSGYRVLETDTLPPAAWTDGYYDLLRRRAQQLAEHPDAGVRRCAADTLREIEIFERHGASYGYVFYALERI